MSALSSLTIVICCAGIGAGMLSVLVPQKRTKRILGFVMGLFILVTVVNGVAEALGEANFSASFTIDSATMTYSEQDYTDAVAQQTAETLVHAVDELLLDEDVAAEDIRLSLKISDEGRILIDRIVIYISETYRSRASDIRSIVYRHLAKEPEIYVQGQEME